MRAKKKMHSDSLDFEYWIRFTLPKQLNLSDSKKAAMSCVLYHFADVARPLERKAPNEFKNFCSELRALVEKAGKKRCPKGYVVWDGEYRKRPKVN